MLRWLGNSWDGAGIETVGVEWWDFLVVVTVLRIGLGSKQLMLGLSSALRVMVVGITNVLERVTLVIVVVIDDARVGN